MTDYSKLSVDEMVQKITRILRKDLLSENPDMEFTDDEDLVLMLLDVFKPYGKPSPPHSSDQLASQRNLPSESSANSASTYQICGLNVF